jgi:hypothetical protein
MGKSHLQDTTVSYGPLLCEKSCPDNKALLAGSVRRCGNIAWNKLVATDHS